MLLNFEKGLDVLSLARFQSYQYLLLTDITIVYIDFILKFIRVLINFTVYCMYNKSTTFSPIFLLYTWYQDITTVFYETTYRVVSENDCRTNNSYESGTSRGKGALKLHTKFMVGHLAVFIIIYIVVGSEFVRLLFNTQKLFLETKHTTGKPRFTYFDIWQLNQYDL